MDSEKEQIWVCFISSPQVSHPAVCRENCVSAKDIKIVLFQRFFSLESFKEFQSSWSQFMQSFLSSNFPSGWHSSCSTHISNQPEQHQMLMIWRQSCANTGMCLCFFLCVSHMLPSLRLSK